MKLDELNAKICKLQGWTSKPLGQVIAYYNDLGNIHGALPHYTHIIADAWELIADAEMHGLSFILHNSQTISPVPGIWSYTASFYAPIGGPAHEEYTAEDETEALAICRAWLAWKESSHE